MTSDTTNHLDLTLMVAFHDAFRRDLGHLAHTTSRHRAQLDEPARRRAVRTGWELFKTQLHMHHTGEDTDLWPRMRVHLAGRPDDLALLQAMEDEHGRIDPLLDAVDGALADRDHGHQRLADTVDALASELSGHLAHEERDTLPLLDRSLTQAEWRAFVADRLALRRRLVHLGEPGSRSRNSVSAWVTSALIGWLRAWAVARTRWARSAGSLTVNTTVGAGTGTRPSARARST